MHLVGIDDVRASLDSAINNRICTEAWLGYGSVLFIGFDHEPMHADVQDESEPKALYLLQSEFADWVIKSNSGFIGTADDDLTKAKAAAQLLIGVRAKCWRFVESSLGLEIEFQEELSVCITPMADTEGDISHKAAWTLRMPNGYYRCARWDGALYDVYKDEPASLEPPF